MIKTSIDEKEREVEGFIMTKGTSYRAEFEWVKILVKIKNPNTE